MGDLNGDFRPDLVFGINGRAPRLLINQTGQDGVAGGGHPLAIKLRGSSGNPKAIGARVSVAVSDLPLQCLEQCAGSGYLTQSSATLFFGLGNQDFDGLDVVVSVRWPDGGETSHEIDSFSLRRGVVTLTSEKP